MEVAGVEARQGQCDKTHQGYDLEDHQIEIDRGAFAGAHQQHAGNDNGDQDPRQVDDPTALRSAG